MRRIGLYTTRCWAVLAISVVVGGFSGSVNVKHANLAGKFICYV